MTMSTPAPRPVEKKPMSPVVPLLGGLLLGGAAAYVFLPKEAHAGEKQIEGDKVKDGEKAGPFLKKGDKVAFIGDLSGTVISDVYHASYGGSETGGTVDVGGPVNGQLVPDWKWNDPSATVPENPAPSDFALLIDVMNDSSPLVAAKPPVLIFSFLDSNDDSGVATLAGAVAKKLPGTRQLWLFKGAISEENRKALMGVKAAWADSLSAYQDGASAAAETYALKGGSVAASAKSVLLTPSSDPVEQQKVEMMRAAVAATLGIPTDQVPDVVSISWGPTLSLSSFLVETLMVDRIVSGIYNLMLS